MEIVIVKKMGTNIETIHTFLDILLSGFRSFMSTLYSVEKFHQWLLNQSQIGMMNLTPLVGVMVGGSSDVYANNETSRQIRCHSAGGVTRITLTQTPA